MTIADLVGRLDSYFRGLSRRERYFVMTAGAAVLVFVVFQFVFLPIAETRKRLKKTLVAETVVLQDMLTLQQEYNSIKEKTAGAGPAGREKNFTLFSFLDTLAGQAGVKDTITYMKPSTSEAVDGGYRLSVVEVKLEAVNLTDLVSYLYRIEASGEMVFVKRLSISRNGGDKTGVDAVMQVETIQK